jgi:hypothetical protein
MPIRMMVLHGTLRIPMVGDTLGIPDALERFVPTTT